MTRFLMATLILVFGGASMSVTSESASTCTCAGNLSDNFDDGVMTWIPSVTCGFVFEFPGSLRPFTSAGGCNGYAQARLEPTVCGDFDVQIDFTELGGYPIDGTRVGGLRVETTGGSLASGIEFNRTIGVGGCVPSSGYKAFGSDSTSCASTYAASSFANRKFRISRQGSTLKAYYWDGSTWVELNSTSGPLSELRLIVYSRAFNDYHGANYSFDNFVLTSESCPTSISPASWSEVKLGRH